MRKTSFGVLVNNIQRLDMVFSKSKIDKSISAHFIKDPDSATIGLNKLLNIIESEGSEIGVLAHSDMYFREGWLKQINDQINKLPDSWIVAGVIGKDLQGRICGKIHDMRIPQQFDTSDTHEFPQAACCFDECVIIVNMKTKFRFQEELTGFDLYGTLCILQTWEMGGTAWVIDAFCEHYCMRPFSWIPDRSFRKNFKWLYNKYDGMLRIDSTALGVPKEVMNFQTSA
jgi:hypothetical protein